VAHPRQPGQASQLNGAGNKLVEHFALSYELKVMKYELRLLMPGVDKVESCFWLMSNRETAHNS
jgi:hypothetical protein